MMRTYMQNDDSVGSDEEDGYNTIEERLNVIKHQVSDILSVTSHIYSIMLGDEILSHGLTKDTPPSIKNTLTVIEGSTYEALQTLESIASELSNTKRLKPIR